MRVVVEALPPKNGVDGNLRLYHQETWLWRDKQRSQLRFLCSQPVEDVRQGAVRILAGLPAVNTGNQPVIGDVEPHICGACGH